LKRKPNKYAKLINKFIKSPSDIWKNQGYIKREMKVAKTLFSKIEDEKFWTQADLPFKLNSLAWFISKDGVDFLNLEVRRLKFKLPKPIEYELEEGKVGEDIETKKQTKTLMDFLKDAS
tara:strand:+ start:674 stop:1030 length:357 start_codon:yes stop_codon:yes gene_type:complete